MSFFNGMTRVALLLGILMTILSAWIRLSDSGIGCSPWPTCFAERYTVDRQPGITISTEDRHRELRMLHRVMASAFAMVILVMTILSLWYRREPGMKPTLPVVCFVLTLVLSVVGINTPDLFHPAVTAVNLTGGMLLVALLWQLVLIQRGVGAGGTIGRSAGVALAAVVLVVLTVTGGSWVSGNFAAASCDGFMSCPRAGDAAFGDAFDPGRELTIENGRLALDANQALISLTHHWSALFATLFILTVFAVSYIERGFDAIATGSAALVILLATLGIAEVGRPTLLTATLHNLLSLALLLMLVYQYNRLKLKHDHD